MLMTYSIEFQQLWLHVITVSFKSFIGFVTTAAAATNLHHG
jgi:hypothetical protein